MEPTVFNIRDVQRLMDVKQERKKESYRKVIDRCFVRIETFARLGKTKCMVEVPDFMFGSPIYDLNDCVRYVSEALVKRGFLVRYFFPRVLYVSWDTQEIKALQAQAQAQAEAQAAQPQTHGLQLPSPQTPSQQQLRLAFAPPPTVAFVPPPPPQQAALQPQQGSQQRKTPKFIKSIAEFKPSGKFVLKLS